MTIITETLPIVEPGTDPHLVSWITHNFYLDLTSETPVSLVYKNYVDYMIKLNQVPLSRKTLVTGLKRAIRSHVSSRQVVFVHKGESMVLGLGLR